HNHGVTVDWTTIHTGHTVQLPTYPFQRQTYWLSPRPRTTPDTNHPILTSHATLAENDTHLLTGRLSATTHPWLADHVIDGNTLFPGTGFVDLALFAGEQAGCPVLEDLTLAAPLVVPTTGNVTLQVTVSPATEEGRWQLAVYSRPDSEPDQAWTRHATGILMTSADTDDLGWSTSGTESVDVRGAYATLAENGYEYGPAFQGLSRLWRQRDEFYAEVDLPEELSVAGHAMHPALLDAALHPLVLGATETLVPFSWTGVRLHATDATSVRVHAAPTGENTYRLRLTDPAGALVAAVDAVALRPVSRHDTAPTAVTLSRLDWVPVTAASTSTVFDLTVAHCSSESDDIVEAAHAGVRDALRLVQEWLADERPPDARLVITTTRAMATTLVEPVHDLPGASIWGLLRSAQREHPDRFVLIDLDRDDVPRELVEAAVSTNEPQVAVRDGRLLAPRVVGMTGSGLLPVPAGESWRLGTKSAGTIDNLAFVPNESARRPLEPGEVRIAIRAAGLNFRDVLIALGMYPGDAPLGSEAAGVVIECDPEVGLSVGERVFGYVPHAFSPVGITDHRLLAPIPDNWSFTDAAAIPVAYLTAY
ncbi:polyketide synthase dehydratase domain-containing protein, partial [Nonomuraea sp. NPDC002799]